MMNSTPSNFFDSLDQSSALEGIQQHQYLGAGGITALDFDLTNDKSAGLNNSHSSLHGSRLNLRSDSPRDSPKHTPRKTKPRPPSTSPAVTSSKPMTSSRPSSTTSHLKREQHQQSNTAGAGGTADRDMIEEAAKNLIEQVNEKRKQDEGLLKDFREAVMEQVEGIVNNVAEQMQRCYAINSQKTQEQLELLYGILERYDTTHEELSSTRKTLKELLRQELAALNDSID